MSQTSPYGQLLKVTILVMQKLQLRADFGLIRMAILLVMEIIVESMSSQMLQAIIRNSTLVNIPALLKEETLQLQLFTS